MCADTDNTTLVKVLCSVFADIGDVGRKFLHTALCLTHLKTVFVNMHRSQDILLDHTLIEHDGILVVISLPRHECHLKVTSQGKFPFLCGITFGKYVTGLHSLPLVANRAEVDCCALVGLTPFRYAVFLYRLFERNEILLLSAVIADTDSGGIYEFDYTVTFGHNLGT